MQSKHSDLRSILYHLRTLSSQIGPAKNITFGEYSALCLISSLLEAEQNKHITPTELNNYFGTKKPATSRMLTMLEKKGFIERLTEVKDHRLTYLVLTNLGKEVLKEEEATYKQIKERVINRMGNDDYEELLYLLEKLEIILKEEIEDLR